MKRTFYALWLCMSFVLYACQQSEFPVSLQGEWKFALDPEDRGVTEQWYTTTLDTIISLPGSLQEQGYGNHVDTATKWTGRVVDKSWYNAPDYARYQKKGNAKVPFWLNPDKHYVGAAWYQKEIIIPEAWNNRPIELELERTHWKTTLYLDGTKRAVHESLGTPFRHVFTDLKPGKHILTLQVDNRLHIDIGVNAHSVSDHTQSNWNGIIGNMFLRPRPSVYLDDIKIRPNVAGRNIEVQVKTGGNFAKDKQADLILQIKDSKGKSVGKKKSISLSAENNNAHQIILPLGENTLLWSEHTPNLYTLQAEIEIDGHKETLSRTFGLRTFKANGTRFEVNGEPIFLRGTLECCIFPLTGYPATDREYWEKIYNQCKAHGLNHVRFHSWCPPEAAFEVADRMGIYLQVECGGWTAVGNGGKLDEWFKEEGDRILKEYGHHPSFCMMAYGNEPNGKNRDRYLGELVDYWKAKDEQRVYTGAAGWPYLSNADFWNTQNPRIQRWGAGLKSIINAQSPRTDFDFVKAIRANMPTVSHEVGQWCVFPNLKERSKYTGVLKAKNFDIFADKLNEHHLGDLADEFLYASGRLQTLCYKADIEGALRTPGFAGFQLLDLHDFPGQGSALVGVLDPFWEEKGYVSPEEYRSFCNELVPLVRFPKMVWSNADTLNVPVEVANFSGSALPASTIIWRILTAGKKEVVAEGASTQDIPVGNCIPAGCISQTLQSLAKPVQLIVQVEVKNKKKAIGDLNQWNIWVYPEKTETVDKQPYIVSKLDANALAQLEKGENVLLLLPQGSILPEKGGSIRTGFSTIFWNTAWTRKQPPHVLGIFCDPKHPVFNAFPTDCHSDYQWWDLMSRCDAMVLDDFPADYRPTIHLIDDWFTSRKLGILMEGKMGKGKLVVCSADLENDLDQRPAAHQFRQSLLQYMASDNFRPSTELKAEWIRGLYEAAN